MTPPIHPNLRTLRRFLQATVLMLTTCLAGPISAAPIDLSIFNAVQVRFRAGDMVWQDTHLDGSKTTRQANASTWDSTDGDFKRGHFEGTEYQAAWNEEIPLSSGKVWKQNGSVSVTLSSANPPVVTAFRIEALSDYPGSQTFGPSKSHYLISGPPTGTTLPLEPSDPKTLVFGVTGAASCTAFSTLTVVYEYPQPGADGVVRSEVINRSASSCTSSVEEYFDIDFWALPPVTPGPTRTPTVTPSRTVTPTLTSTRGPTPTITPPALCGEASGAAGATAAPYCPEVVTIDLVQAIGLRERVEHWKDGQPDKNFAPRKLDEKEQQILVTGGAAKPGKPTWVRVYVTNPDPDPNGLPVGATLTLHGTRGATDLGRLSPQTKSVPPGVTVDRENPKNSRTVFDFKLPPDWRQGSGSFTAEILQPAQALGRDVSYEFKPRKPLRVGYVFFDDATDKDKAIATRAAWLMQLMFPTVVEYFEYSPVTQAANPTTEARQLKLASLLKQPVGGSADVLIGWTRGATAGPGNGRAYREAATGESLCDSGPKVDQPCTLDDECTPSQPGDTPFCAKRFRQKVLAMVAPMPATPDWAAEVLVHEIGHLFLLEHPHNITHAGSIPSWVPWGCEGCPGPKKVWDDTVTPLHKVPAPYIETNLIQGLKSRNRGQLPTGAGRTDFEFMWQSGGGNKPWALGERRPMNVWISQASWNWLFDKFLPPTRFGEHGEAAVLIPSLLVRGFVAQDGSAGRFEPALPAAGPDPAQSEGTYCLELQDGNGATWRRQCFEPTEVGDDGDTGPSPFVQAVMLFGDLARVRLYHGATMLAEQPVSAHAPTVRITAPAAGTTLIGTTTLRWVGEDLDGDPLSYAVQYSRDNRQSWIALTVDEPASELPLDTRTLAGSDAAWVRVIASDGLNFVTAEVGPLHVPTKGPQLAVALPEPGTTFHQGEPITFMATGFDAEDGGTPTEAFTWTSDRDGLIDTDEVVTTRSLSVGRHVVRVSAADTDGNVASASVDVTIIPFCIGDCGVNGTVTVDELVKGVNIALGNATVDDCVAFDGDENQRVTVDELVQAVNAALNGCP